MVRDRQPWRLRGRLPSGGGYGHIARRHWRRVWSAGTPRSISRILSPLDPDYDEPTCCGREREAKRLSTWVARGTEKVWKSV